MRVLVLSYLYPSPDDPTRGIFVHEQAAALRAAGVDARVLSGEVVALDPLRPVATLRRVARARRDARPEGFAERNGVPAASFPVLVPRGLWARLAADRYRAGALAAAARLRAGFGFDLVHAHTAHLDGWAGVAVAARAGVPLVLTEHSGPFRTLTATPGMRRRTQAAVAGAARGIAVSHALWRAMRAEVDVPHAERWQVLPNGVDAARFARAAQAGAPPGDGTIRALWVGHLVPIKRPLALLEAFARARAREPRLRLALVGGGPLEAAARARAQALGVADAVTLHPVADRDGVASHLARSHFLVLASEAETFGVVVIEALAAGRPVLSTRCGGPEEILTDPRLGLVVDGDVEALAEGFLALARRVAAGVDAAWIRAHAASRYDHAVVAGRLRTLYAELVAAAPSAAAAAATSLR